MTLFRSAAACSLGLLVLAAGCSNRPTAEAAAGAAAANAAISPETLKPMKSGASAAPAAEILAGTVAETMDAASYTYMRLTTADRGEVWAAASQFPVKVGDRVELTIDMPMENFHSSALNRDFPMIYFASAAATGASPAAGDGQAALPPGHPPMGMGGAKAPVEAPTQPMAAPAGGLTIADVWAKKQALAGQTVTVHGKVMKFNGGIMGRNWVHLQDGTGSDKDGTHDLTLTTDAVVKPGDVVTLKGTLAVDKDFTAGYKYPVIVEGAQIVK